MGFVSASTISRWLCDAPSEQKILVYSSYNMRGNTVVVCWQACMEGAGDWTSNVTGAVLHGSL